MILALFSSIAEAKTFENQAAEARKKGVFKMKTQRMDPQDADAFPMISWQDTLTAFKAFTSERVSELRTSNEGDDEVLAKINACNEIISCMRCWRMYNLRAQKHYFEILCPFRPGTRFHTSGTSSPFTVITITDLK